MKMQLTFLIVCCAAWGLGVSGQQKQRAEPVPILKQISRQNDDGSYSFGYENGDGSYKIETKYPDGEVQGKYGYVDDSGNLREVEYGASSKRGFEPQGSDINVPPPTLSNEVKPGPLGEGEEDDGQYREDPSIYDTKDYKNSKPAQRAQAARRPAYQQSFQTSSPTYVKPAANNYQQPANNYQQPANNYQQPANTYQQPANNYQQSISSFQQRTPQTFQFQRPAQQTFADYQQPQQQVEYQQPTYQPAGRSFQGFQQPQYSSYTQQPSYSSQYSNLFNGHPSVNNFDIGTGSYSISY